MIFNKICEDVSNAIKNILNLSDHPVSVLVENNGDISFELSKSQEQDGLSVIVGITNFERRGGSGDVIFGNATFSISIYENPEMTRLRENCLTAQDVAEKVAQALHFTSFDGLTSPLLFKSMTRADEPPRHIMQMNFNAELVLSAIEEED